MTEILTLAIVFVASYFGTAVFRRWSLGRGVIDVPNERSSHVNPTPRGGGIVFVSICLTAYLINYLFGNGSFSWGYFVGAIVIAGISWLDDLRSVSFAVRLGLHFFSALILIADAVRQGAFPTIQNGPDLVLPSIAVVWIVWMINAYNFMDGIDGIAGLQAFIAGVSWLLLGVLTGMTGASAYAGVVAFSVLGFLIHNWQPAKIFMGDVGSAFLGFSLAALPFLQLAPGSESLNVYIGAGVIFVWFFVFDSVLTFLRRLLRREKVWEAHRSHLYQRMVINGMSHAKVTIIYGAFAALLSGLFIVTNYGRNAELGWETFSLVMPAVVVLSMLLVILSNRKDSNIT
ncbi:MAG TPA: glycosyltransferase family 4 protein [Pyrinomonadaceae bacterium]|nr:glycosyltransferase family 4 protein [Pyrinomonadaceae bacterium]